MQYVIYTKSIKNEDKWCHSNAVIILLLERFVLACIVSPVLKVVIDITYTPPEPGYQPPYYRAASSVTLTCRSVGGTGQIRYIWSSTCSNCFVPPGNAYYRDDGHSISDSILTARDAGTHTCTAYNNSLGISGSASTVVNVIGEAYMHQYPIQL